MENELDEVLEKIDNLIGSGRYMDCTVFLEKSTFLKPIKSVISILQ